MKKMSNLPTITNNSMHIHLNPVGGISGDMFIAAVLDLYPELEKPMMQTRASVNCIENVQVNVVENQDSVLRGKQFKVRYSAKDYHSTSYIQFSKILADAGLEPAHRDISFQILEELAAAESFVHGVAKEDVHLHEVGSPDSIVDIVFAGYLMQQLRGASWSCDALPIGRGRVHTQHGELPLPAPAVAILLEGAPVYDDGRLGERVTPTGAAILKVLNPDFNLGRSSMNLIGTGTGYGTSRIEGLCNVLRLLAFEPIEMGSDFEQISLVEFEVDDQSPEDLSTGLNRLRGVRGVLDVVQIPAIGKKGRMTVHVQVLGEMEYLQDILAACFNETSTLGVRYQTANRVVLRRADLTLSREEDAVPVKIAKRDGGVTAKVESDHLAQVGNYGSRKREKQKFESVVESSAEFRNLLK